MGFLEKFLPKEDRAAAFLLYGMVLATCFNGMIDIQCQHCYHTSF
jgi:hypothetical protein